MIVECESCQTRFNVDPDRIKDEGSKVRCSHCRHVFKIYKPGSETEPEPQPEPETPLEEEAREEPREESWDEPAAPVEDASQGPGAAVMPPDDDGLGLGGVEEKPVEAGADFFDHGGLAAEGSLPGLDSVEAPTADEAPVPDEAVAEEPAGEESFAEDEFDFGSAEDDDGLEGLGDIEAEPAAEESPAAAPSAEDEFDLGGLDEDDDLEGLADIDAEPDAEAPSAAEPSAEDDFDFGGLDDDDGLSDLDAESLPADEGEDDFDFGELEEDDGLEGLDDLESEVLSEDDGGDDFDFGGLDEDDDQERLADIEAPAGPEGEAVGDELDDLDFGAEDFAGDETVSAADAGAGEEDFMAEPGQGPEEDSDMDDILAGHADEADEPEPGEEYAFVDDEAVEAAAAAAAAPMAPKKKGRRLLWVLVIVFALAAAAAALWFFAPDVISPLVSSGAGEEISEEDQMGNRRIEPENVQHVFRQNEAEGQILVITGQARNRYDHPRSFLRLRGMLHDAGGEVLAQSIVFCGNVLTEDDLMTLPLSEIEQRLRVRGGKAGANMNVMPGQGVDFMIVFGNIPKDLSEYTVEAFSSEPVK